MRSGTPASAHTVETRLGEVEDMGFERGVPTGDAVFREEHTTASARIAILIPAHNEEPDIERSARSAAREAGAENVHVVSVALTERFLEP